MSTADIEFENQLFNEYFNSKDTMKGDKVKIMTNDEIVNYVIDNGQWRLQSSFPAMIASAIKEYNNLVAENRKRQINFEDIFFNDEAFDIN